LNAWLRERRPPRASPSFVVIALTGPWLLLIDEYWGALKTEWFRRELIF
jgi:hypothetical protein